MLACSCSRSNATGWSLSFSLSHSHSPITFFCIYFHLYLDVVDLVVLVQNTVRDEQDQSAKRPIYLVGESLGASLALLVAAQNPDIDFVLILANPGRELCVRYHQDSHESLHKLVTFVVLCCFA